LASVRRGRACTDPVAQNAQICALAKPAELDPLTAHSGGYSRAQERPNLMVDACQIMPGLHNYS
jgi:hypothetical protein